MLAEKLVLAVFLYIIIHAIVDEVRRLAREGRRR